MTKSHLLATAPLVAAPVVVAVAALAMISVATRITKIALIAIHTTATATTVAPTATVPPDAALAILIVHTLTWARYTPSSPSRAIPPPKAPRAM